ncbi:M14 family zinc carboxypeptidase [Fluctibacter corallii]|uniref:M14 family zinc carboxypeptidase n=1 Tax=Fluctibacter corallii TaxID=2984329 RepID=UPI0038503590
MTTSAHAQNTSATLSSNSETVHWPDTQYTKDIPTFNDVLGYSPGERISSHAQMLRYFEALERAAPERIKLIEYAKSWEGRTLFYAVLGSPSNLASLDEFASNMQKLANPDLHDNEQALIDTLPASVWLGYGVHGNEISSTDAAMFTAYHLLASPTQSTNQSILNNTLVFIDPLQNPDGRTRFTSRYYATVGMEHSADRQSAEHNEPWPNGRTNHYLFDMNRDWLAITQPETAGRIAAMNTYTPLVVIDLHEMGGDASYYFAPAAQPVNPHMTASQIENMGLIGENHGEHFDAFGFDYFTREIFDAFYPGYGDSWPTFYGASASTYEVGSSRGEVFRKRNGDIYTYADSVQKQFVASISTAEATAKHRKKLLKDFYDYQLSAIKAGNDTKQRYYVFSPEYDRAGAYKLARLMAKHGVRVEQATEPFKACSASYPSGTFIIDSAQPKGRFVTTTFSEQVDMSEAFIKEQERRRARHLHDEIYDVTGWSLPLMFNIDAQTCSRVSAKTQSVSDKLELRAKVTNPNADVAYIIPWGDMAAVNFLTMALRENVIVKSANEAFTLKGGKTYPAGSLIIEKRRNQNVNIQTLVTTLAEETGAIVDGVNSSWVIKGPSLGSGNTPELVTPKVAMAWGESTSVTSAGNTRFVIERQMGYPVTAINVADLSNADLSRYHVLILPHGYYQSALGESGASHINEWVSEGGVLVTMSGATKFIADADVLDVSREYAVRDSNDEPSPDKGRVSGTLISSHQALLDTIVNADSNPDYVAGVLANVAVDQEHWLTAGVKPNVVGLVGGSDIYTPIKLTSGHNLAWFKGEDKVLASGYLWEENKKQLAYKPFLIQQPVGNGMIIAFTQEPTFRAYMDGLNVMFANALFRAPAHTRTLR